MYDYTLQHADATGARFAGDPDTQVLAVLPFAAAAVLLTVFGGQALWQGEVADRVWAYGLFALALGAAGGGWAMWRRPRRPPVLRFDNLSRTLTFEDAAGRPVQTVPYAQVAPFEAGRYSSESGSQSYTTYTISVTLADGRHLRLCRDSESVRDEQLALLQRCVRLATQAQPTSLACPDPTPASGAGRHPRSAFGVPFR
ncbi:hypothetical protein TBR22_A14940 [Luteitalea sp. TBR-22]|uniref:hypothetical protein n=1 Tax=Luteitalea sp. TBR-22 TaxID=2802971 RepID=UPI001AF3344E|nr:hypothetical protein [Luteitalea sp. TBR-22]BCS32284.1 hypothetical protein TBR22_A14940 [Luteitalea sp. TBR-22]